MLWSLLKIAIFIALVAAAAWGGGLLMESDGGIRVSVGTTVADAEKKLVLETLKRMGNNKTRAAKALGIDVRTIRYKLRAWEDE